MSDEQSIRDEIAQLLEQHRHEYDSDCGMDFGCECEAIDDYKKSDMTHAEHLTDTLMPLIRRIQAEVLREFAQSIPGDVHDPRHVADLARGVADHIEREAAILADIALAVFEKARTPTDDERGWSTADRQAASGEAHRRFDEWAETRGQDIAGASINGFILGAEWWKSRRTVQCEPSDAQVKAALHALYAIQHPHSAPGEIADYGDEVVTAMRAALRAAAGVGVVGQGGESRG